MATFPHPKYPGLVIIVGDAKPQLGSFYATKPGRVLSHIAKLAYGSGKLNNVLRINNTAGNRANCVYRESSTNCFSPTASGQAALNQRTWNPGAWLSFCQKDKNPAALSVGSQYQVIWIPPLDDAQPEDLALAPLAPPRSPTEPDPGVSFMKPPRGAVTVPALPGVPVDDGRGGVDIGDRPVDSGSPVPIKKAGFPWWLGVGLGIIALGGVVVIGGGGFDKNKKKKRKR